MNDDSASTVLRQADEIVQAGFEGDPQTPYGYESGAFDKIIVRPDDGSKIIVRNTLYIPALYQLKGLESALAALSHWTPHALFERDRLPTTRRDDSRGNRILRQLEALCADPEEAPSAIALLRAHSLLLQLPDLSESAFVAGFGDQVLIQWSIGDRTIDIYVSDQDDFPSFAMVAEGREVREILIDGLQSLYALLSAD